MRDLKDLPNIEGYMFVGVYKDDCEEILQIKINPDGTHYVHNFNLLKGWKPVFKPNSYIIKKQ